MFVQISNPLLFSSKFGYYCKFYFWGMLKVEGFDLLSQILKTNMQNLF